MDIYKFGGSSVATAERMKKVFSIVENIDACIIVLSAIGKKNYNDEKVTDLLIELCNSKNNTIKTERLKKRIKNKFFKITEKIAPLHKADYFKQTLNYFFENIGSYSDNYIISRGEYFTCLIFSLMTKIPFIDASGIIRFDTNNRISFEETKKAIGYINYKKFITCGFYGSDKKGNITLFPRGGGDVTGAVLSRVCGSKNFYNYTDVNGIYTIPPEYSGTNITIAETNYSRLKTICSYGTQTFCNEAIKYIADKKITLYIKNTFDPSGKSTKISDDFNSSEKPCVFVRKGLVKLEIAISERFEIFGILFEFLKYIMSHKIVLTRFSCNKESCVFYIFENDFSIIKNHPILKNARNQKKLIQITKVMFLTDSRPIKKNYYLSSNCSEKTIKRQIDMLIDKNE